MADARTAPAPTAASLRAKDFFWLIVFSLGMHPVFDDLRS